MIFPWMIQKSWRKPVVWRLKVFWDAEMHIWYFLWHSNNMPQTCYPFCCIWVFLNMSTISLFVCLLQIPSAVPAPPGNFIFLVSLPLIYSIFLYFAIVHVFDEFRTTGLTIVLYSLIFTAHNMFFALNIFDNDGTNCFIYFQNSIINFISYFIYGCKGYS